MMVNRTVRTWQSVTRPDIVERSGATVRTVDELVEDYEVANFEVRLERANRTRGDNRPHT